MAERYIQVIQNMLIKANEMLEARNIPADGLATPAQLICGQKLRSVLP